MAKLFEIDRATIGNLFKTSSFQIPDFQRDYDWDGEYSTFIDDIITSYNQQDDEYYIGTVISFKDNNGFSQVIDGQQRLTSLFILTAAYWIFLGEKKSTVTKQDSVKRILVKDDETWSSDNEDIFLLQTSDPSGQEWIENVMRTGKPKEINDKSKKHNSALKKALAIFRDAEDPAELFKHIMNGIVISHVEALDFRQAYIVFERMNDRGKELTIPDKIKYILMGKHTKNIDEFINYSQSINEKCRQVADEFKNDNDFTTFLIHYFVAFLITDSSKWIDQADAVSWFRRYWDTKKEPIPLLDDMYKKALLYNGYKEAFDNSPRPIKNDNLKYKRSYFASNITQHLPMLLAASDCDPEEFDVIAGYVLKLCFVMQVTKKNWNSVRDGKNKSITSFVMNIRDRDFEKLEKNVLGLLRKVCDEENFTSSITSKGFFEDGSKNNLRKFTILKIEEIVVTESGGTYKFQDEEDDTSKKEEKHPEAKRPPRSKTTGQRITNEHIIAANTSAKAIMESIPKFDGQELMHAEDIKNLIGRLGNFVALGEVLNKKLQDAPTRDKREAYIKQNRTDTARLIFDDIISTPTKGSNAETRTIEKYGFEPIELSYVSGLDEDGKPVYSEDWDAIYDKDKNKHLIDGKEVEGYFLEKQIAKRESIILKIIQHWLGLTGQETVKGRKIIDDNLFTHPQEKLFN